MSPTVRWLGRGTTRTQGHGPVTLFGALIAATLDLKVVLLPEGPDLTVQAEARGWGWDGGLEGRRPEFQSPSGTNLPGTLSFPRCGSGRGTA